MDYFPTEMRANFQLKAAENGKHPLLSPVSRKRRRKRRRRRWKRKRRRRKGRRIEHGEMNCVRKRRGGGRGRGGRGWDN